MLPKWLQSGIPFQGRVTDLAKFLIALPIVAVAQIYKVVRFGR